MLVSERFQNVNLFSKMNDVKPLPTNNIISPDALNKLWLVKSGFKSLGSIQSLSDDDIAVVLSSMFNDKWESLVTSLSNVTTGYKETYSEQSTGNNVMNETSNSTSNNNVSAYNAEDFTPKESTSDNVTSNNTNDKTGTRDYVKTIQRNSDVTAKETVINFLQNNNICNIIFTDIDKVMCLSVYE